MTPPRRTSSRSAVILAVLLAATLAASAGCSTGPGDTASTNQAGSSGGPPVDAVTTNATVVRLVDGDTIVASVGGREESTRLIGIDTPETVHPTEPIECYGPEASAFAERTLQGEPVTLEFDRTQGRRDYYGRTLAYVWRTRPSPQLFNLAAVRRGYALEYTYDTAYTWQQPVQACRTSRPGRPARRLAVSAPRLVTDPD